MHDLDGSVAVVTGAASGIGFAQEGMNVVPPEDVAGTVVAAIRSERFWITTTTDFDAVVRDRNESFLTRRNPSTTPAL